MPLSTELVHHCSKPADTRDFDRASLHLLDWLGTVLATRGTEAEVNFGHVAGFPQGAVTGLTHAEVQPETAAFALGALGSLLEMDDLHRSSILHAGDVVCPASLSVAFWGNASGADLLHALLAGYEVALRLGISAASGGYTAWYNSASCGVFGAAIAASRVLKLDQTAQAEALGHAGMQASGLWQCRLAPGYAKQLGSAHAARAGVTAAMAAKAKIGAPLDILEGELGFFKTFYPAVKVLPAMKDAEDRWLLHEVSLKPWSACRHTHPAIAAALALRESGINANTASKITVSTYGAAIAFCDAPDPQTAHEARFSLQHAVALALLKGAPERADFEVAANRENAVIADLRHRIRLHDDPEMSSLFPQVYSAVVTVESSTGRTYHAAAPHAPGDPEMPLTKEQVASKFMTNCRDGGISPEGAERLISAVRGLPEAPDLSTLKDALKTAIPDRRQT